jgi:hypothetical protein
LLVLQALTQYKLDVKTSDVKGADFDGLAYITFSGCWGDSKEVRPLRTFIV